MDLKDIIYRLEDLKKLNSFDIEDLEYQKECSVHNNLEELKHINLQNFNFIIIDLEKIIEKLESIISI